MVSQSIGTSQPGSHSGEATSDHDAIGAAVIAHAAETEVYIGRNICSRAPVPRVKAACRVAVGLGCLSEIMHVDKQ